MARSAVANGTIRPSRFVKLDTTAPGKVLECDADEKMYGISQSGTRRAPHDDTDDGNAAIVGENIQVFEADDVCWLEAGGTIAIDDRLESDNDGKGTTTTTDNEWVGAIALQSGVSGQLIKVKVIEPARY
jgi:hypothetical protein